jgi:hypothetical protein
MIWRIVVDVHPLGTLPKKGSTKRIRNEICLSSERSGGELFHFPLGAGFFRGPEGQRLEGVSFASFSCRHKKREWPAGASPGQHPRSAIRFESPERKPQERKPINPFQISLLLHSSTQL